MVGKLRLIDRQGASIRNVLVLLDASTLHHTTDRYQRLFVKHPLVSGNGWMTFHATFLRAYLSPSFMVPFLGQKLLGREVPYFPSPFQKRSIEVDPISNDFRPTLREQELAADPVAYYEKREQEFYPRDKDAPNTAGPDIREPARRLLEEMRMIFSKHKTDFRIVISPLWDQQPLDSSDLATVVAIFGKGRVFDFSGVNRLTNDIHNYYESSHFRPHVGREIIGEIYRPLPSPVVSCFKGSFALRSFISCELCELQEEHSDTVFNRGATGPLSGPIPRKRTQAPAAAALSPEAFETCFSTLHLSKLASECMLTYIQSLRGSP